MTDWANSRRESAQPPARAFPPTSPEAQSGLTPHDAALLEQIRAERRPEPARSISQPLAIAADPLVDRQVSKRTIAIGIALALFLGIGVNAFARWEAHREMYVARPRSAPPIEMFFLAGVPPGFTLSPPKSGPLTAEMLGSLARSSEIPGAFTSPGFEAYRKTWTDERTGGIIEVLGVSHPDRRVADGMFRGVAKRNPPLRIPGDAHTLGRPVAQPSTPFYGYLFVMQRDTLFFRVVLGSERPGVYTQSDAVALVTDQAVAVASVAKSRPPAGTTSRLELFGHTANVAHITGRIYAYLIFLSALVLGTLWVFRRLKRRSAVSGNSISGA